MVATADRRPAHIVGPSPPDLGRVFIELAHFIAQRPHDEHRALNAAARSAVCIVELRVDPGLEREDRAGSQREEDERLDHVTRFASRVRFPGNDRRMRR